LSPSRTAVNVDGRYAAVANRTAGSVTLYAADPGEPSPAPRAVPGAGLGWQRAQKDDLGTPIPGSTWWGPLADGRTSKSKIDVGM